VPEGDNLETRVREGRTALAITILLIVGLTVPTMFLGGAFGLAEAQQSPSPTGTAPTIELVNPSDYEGTPVLSDKDNNPGNDSSGDSPEDEKYHFNAWTRNAPNNATVEFFIVQSGNTISLGLGTNRGGGVYDLYAGIPDTLSDAAATVRVVLFSGGELDRDEQAVVINQVTEDPMDETVLMQRQYRATNAAETVEITYPQNTGGVGFFGRQGQPKAANVEVQHSRTGTAGSAGNQGGGPENIRVYYTTSHRGTDPEWKECGDDESQTDAADGVRCELLAGDQPEWVTGIAVVAMDEEAAPNTPQNLDTDPAANGGDAHVAVGYNQVPSAVTITSPPGSTSIPGCSPLIPVTVSDQIGREITGAPVDVHAQGPADSLSFVTESDITGGTGEPHDSKAPENHATEQSRECDGTLSDENQGEHEEAGTQPDRKHVESVDGTDGDGQYVYRMWNNVAGGTTMTAFVDMDDNDRFCASEASGNGVINWGTGGPAAPLPSAPEEQVCNASSSGSVSPSRSASPSTSPSASTSPSTSPSASTSPSTSPSGSASPSGSTSPSTTASSSPTASTSSSPQQAGVEITLEASQSRKTFGKSFTLSGSVSSDNAACTDLVTVQILRDVVGGEDDFELFAQETTDSNGAYTVTDRADRSANYIARVSETTACDDATSAPQPVLVRAKVSLTLSRDKVQRGGRVRFTIKSAPCPLTARDRVLLFRAIEGEFGKSGRTTTNNRCVGEIVRRVTKSSVFQGRWPKQAPELLSGRSRSKAVRVTD
jgi:hypothetical protein